MGDWEGTKEKNSFFQWTRMNNCRHDHQTDMHFDKTDYSMNLFPFSFFLQSSVCVHCSWHLSVRLLNVGTFQFLENNEIPNELCRANI